MPWDEPGGSEDEDVARGLDSAIQAVEAATATTNPAEQKRDLQKALQQTTGTAHVRKVLAEFGWNGLDFPQTPDLKALKEQLLLAKAEYCVGGVRRGGDGRPVQRCCFFLCARKP